MPIFLKLGVVSSNSYYLAIQLIWYATKGFRANHHRYIFDSDDPSQPRNVRLLGLAIRSYLTEAHHIGCDSETTDSHWTFCFNGELIFPIALTPAHDKRRSRYASNLLIAMQPKWVIDNLMSTPEKRHSATSTVRGLLKDYDDIEISSDLSTYGEEGKSESRQLTLLDENNPSECPYSNFDA
ncbi:hypothetical protein N431DRAFT_490643 [Stipitochalara longipes BDJ]|nr:hypothetical protein N431DRAFT_490643 [Stipitochalara longipes BDJ]